MSRPPDPPLRRAIDRLADLLNTKAAARRWYERYVGTLGSRAVVDTANRGKIAWVHRRDAGSGEVLPLPSVAWTTAQVGEHLLEGIAIHDGRQRITLLYDDAGALADRSFDPRFQGRLVELVSVITNDEDGIAASADFVAHLSNEHHGPGRVHYPVPVSGGVNGAWRAGLFGCRRALFDGRVPDDALFVVADGLEGAAVGTGRTREEALDAYAGEVAKALPQQRRIVQTATDDYDDEGNLIAQGEAPPGLTEPAPPSAASTYLSLPEDEPQAWRPESDAEAECISFGPITIRGPRSDAPPVPKRPECVPYVVLPLEPSPETPPLRGRWTRSLGEVGVTRHAVRIEEAGAITLVGSDLLGLVDLKGLGAVLDAVDAQISETPPNPTYERYVRYRARQYRWGPTDATHPEGLRFASGSSGPRFDAGGLDGDALQAMVRRHRRVLRPAD